jgi:hypothetical protein
VGTPKRFVQVDQRFGHYRVINPDARTAGNRRAALVHCDCGTEQVVMIYHLLDGVTVSCGCAQRRPDGFPRSHPLYGTWFQMLNRCENAASDSYSRYGGRGIAVCERWHDPWLFAEDIAALGPRPEGCTLDRRDNDGNYEPDNIRWASWKFQQRNRQLSIVTAQRRELVRELAGLGLGAAQVARELGIPRHVAADDLEWLRREGIQRALEEELAAAKRRIHELEWRLAWGISA